MASNVLTWAEACRRKCAVSRFSFDPSGIPIGEIVAELYFKIWSKKLMAINCYFVDLESGQHFIITVFCTPAGYYLKDKAVDFARCPVRSQYHLQINFINGKHWLGRAELI